MDFSNLEEKIRERKSKITSQFKEIEEMETQLLKHYQNSVKSVYSSLKSNMEEQGLELFKSLKVSEREERKVLLEIMKKNRVERVELKKELKTYRWVMVILLPIVMVGMMSMGIYMTKKYYQNQNQTIEKKEK